MSKETTDKIQSQKTAEDKTTQFLGKEMTHGEYQEACRNLAGFFEILISWKKGESDES